MGPCSAQSPDFNFLTGFAPIISMLHLSPHTSLLVYGCHRTRVTYIASNSGSYFHKTKTGLQPEHFGERNTHNGKKTPSFKDLFFPIAYFIIPKFASDLHDFCIIVLQIGLHRRESEAVLFEYFMKRNCLYCPDSATSSSIREMFGFVDPQKVSPPLCFRSELEDHAFAREMDGHYNILGVVIPGIGIFLNHLTQPRWHITKFRSSTASTNYSDVGAIYFPHYGVSRGTVVARWTAGHQVERMSKHLGHDSYQN